VSGLKSRNDASAVDPLRSLFLPFRLLTDLEYGGCPDIIDDGVSEAFDLDLPLEVPSFALLPLVLPKPFDLDLSLSGRSLSLPFFFPLLPVSVRSVPVGSSGAGLRDSDELCL